MISLLALQSSTPTKVGQPSTELSLLQTPKTTETSLAHLHHNIVTFSSHKPNGYLSDSYKNVHSPMDEVHAKKQILPILQCVQLNFMVGVDAKIPPLKSPTPPIKARRVHCWEGSSLSS